MKQVSLLRSLLITDPLVILATFCFGSVNLVVSFFDPSGRVQVSIARGWSRALLLIGGVNLQLHGAGGIAPEGSYVFSANHLSYMDTPVVLAAIPVQFRFLAKSGLFKIPLLGHHLKRAGHIPVPREDARAAIKTMAVAADVIRSRGISLLVFPEGGRSLDGELQDFREGAAYIAIRAGVPLVPVAIKGTREVLPMGSANIRAGVVQVWVGDPIPTVGLTLRDRARVTEESRRQIAAMLAGEAAKIHA